METHLGTLDVPIGHAQDPLKLERASSFASVISRSSCMRSCLSQTDGWTVVGRDGERCKSRGRSTLNSFAR